MSGRMGQPEQQCDGLLEHAGHPTMPQKKDAARQDVSTCELCYLSRLFCSILGGTQRELRTLILAGGNPVIVANGHHSTLTDKVLPITGKHRN